MAKTPNNPQALTMQIKLDHNAANFNIKLSYAQLRLIIMQIGLMIKIVDNELPTAHYLHDYKLPDELDIDQISQESKMLHIAALKSTLARFYKRYNNLADKAQTLQIESPSLERDRFGDLVTINKTITTAELFLVKMSYPEALAYYNVSFSFNIFSEETQAIADELFAGIDKFFYIFQVQQVYAEYPIDL